MGGADPNPVIDAPAATPANAGSEQWNRTVEARGRATLNGLAGALKLRSDTFNSGPHLGDAPPPRTACVSYTIQFLRYWSDF